MNEKEVLEKAIEEISQVYRSKNNELNKLSQRLDQLKGIIKDGYYLDISYKEYVDRTKELESLIAETNTLSDVIEGIGIAREVIFDMIERK